MMRKRQQEWVATRRSTSWLEGCLLVAALTVILMQLSGCASAPPATGKYLAAAGQDRASAESSPESVYGIRVDGLHLSAHGYILDLRYRVLDPDKAAALLDAKNKVYLLDESHGAKLGVPQSPKIGGMRQTSRNHVVYTDRDYFILFVNPGRVVRPGDTLKLAVGDSKLAELKVQ